jgi:hypothetical protein
VRLHGWRAAGQLRGSLGVLLDQAAVSGALPSSPRFGGRRHGVLTCVRMARNCLASRKLGQRERERIGLHKTQCSIDHPIIAVWSSHKKTRKVEHVWEAHRNWICFLQPERLMRCSGIDRSQRRKVRASYRTWDLEQEERQKKLSTALRGSRRRWITTANGIEVDAPVSLCDRGRRDRRAATKRRRNLSLSLIGALHLAPDNDAPWKQSEEGVIIVAIKYFFLKRVSCVAVASIRGTYCQKFIPKNLLEIYTHNLKFYI